MGSPEGAGCGRSKRGPKYAKRILGLNQCAAWVQCSQGAPRRGGVWRIEAGPEIREADFGIEPMRRIDPCHQCAKLSSCTWRRLSRWAKPIRVPPRVTTAATRATEPWCHGLKNLSRQRCWESKEG